MHIFDDGIYVQSINQFFPFICNSQDMNEHNGEEVRNFYNIILFENIKCNLSVYFQQKGVFYVDAQVLSNYLEKKDLYLSFFQTENKLNDIFGKPLLRKGKLFWHFYDCMSSKRIINNVIVEHLLYEHFGYCEKIVLKFQ